METTSLALILVVIMVTIYDFTNGFHDASDMVATAIAAHSMRPVVAIIIVSIATFIAPFTIGLAVADTVGTFINIKAATALSGEAIIFSALLAAVSYNLATWLLGYPSSSSNSLAGGLVGAGLYVVGSEHINWGISALQKGELQGVMKVISGLLISPLFGFITGFFIMKLMLNIFKRFKHRINHLFVASQYLSIAWLGFSHGANDAQKGMAIIGMMLLATGTTSIFSIPDWTILLCTSAITLGTMFGGWRIIKTLGFGLYRIRTVHSVANQLGAAMVNSLATSIGAPTSTTQVVTATLLGNGAAEKPGHVKWKTAAAIISGWWLNIPVSMLLGWLYCLIYIALRGS